MPRIRNKAKAPSTLQSAFDDGVFLAPWAPGRLPLTGSPITIAEPADGADIIFTAGVAGGNGELGGRGGRIIWQITGGPSIIMHGPEAEYSFTIEQDNKVLLSLPRDLTDGKYSLENIVREIVQREIRLATVASIKEVVKQELGAVKGYGKAAAQVATDLRDMGFDGEK